MLARLARVAEKNWFGPKPLVVRPEGDPDGAQKFDSVDRGGSLGLVEGEWNSPAVARLEMAGTSSFILWGPPDQLASPRVVEASVGWRLRGEAQVSASGETAFDTTSAEPSCVEDRGPAVPAGLSS